MRAIFDHVDDSLIDEVFQPLVDWTEQNLLVDCFQLARLCSNTAAFAWIWYQGGEVAAAVRSGWAGLMVFQTVLLLLVLGSIMVLHAVFQRVQGAGSANPLRAGMYVHRFGLLLGLVGGIFGATIGRGSLALMVVGFFAAAAAYVGACSNAPPRQWDAGWGRRLALLPRKPVGR